MKPEDMMAIQRLDEWAKDLPPLPARWSAVWIRQRLALHAHVYKYRIIAAWDALCGRPD